MANRYTVSTEKLPAKNVQSSGQPRLSSSEKFAYFASLIFGSMICAVVVTSFFVNFRPFGFAPDLCIALVVACAIRFGCKTASLAGLFCGFFMDTFSKSGLSFLIIFYIFAGILASFASESQKLGNLPPILKFLITAFGAIFAKGIISFIFMCLTSLSVSITTVFSKVIFPEMLCSLIFCLLPYGIVALVYKFVRKRQNKSAN